MSSYYLLKLNHNKFNYIFFIDYTTSTTKNIEYKKQ